MAKGLSKKELSKIQRMSYNQLGQAIADNKLDLPTLRKAYTQMRDIAQKRIKRMSEVTEEFGKPELHTYSGDTPYFRKLKNITTTSELIREISDVSKFTRTKKTTITGMRKERDYLVDKFQDAGFDVDESDYIKLKEFLQWFYSSGASLKYPSDSEETAELFNQGSTRADWERLLNAYEKAYSVDSPSKRY